MISWFNFYHLCRKKTHENYQKLRNLNITGRSMVEMIGVLAIIGVLSVGAIAGYSSAMMKYKLNKQAQQFTTIINLMSRHTQSFEGTANGTQLLPLFIKMGEIPNEMIKSGNTAIYDVFNTKITMNYQRDTDIQYLIMMTYPEISKSSTNNLEICKNIIVAAKENSANIRTLQTIGTSEGVQKYTFIYGDAHCNGNNRCLRNISLDDIYTVCTANLNKEGTHLKIVWTAL